MCFRVPNAVDGHDSPELEIYGMDGIPPEDLHRHQDGLPIVPYTKGKLIIGDSSILPILAAQKASVAAQLAESKSLTVSGGEASVVSPVMSSVPLGSINASSSGSINGSGVIVSAPIAPIQQQPQSATSPSQSTAYWNNPYMMAAAYYQQYAPPSNDPNAYAAAAQYYNYYQSQAYAANYYAGSGANATNVNVNGSGNVDVIPDTITSNSQSDQQLIIPPYVDPKTNKPVPGTIFTVLDLDRSMEELRSELKKYKVIK